MFERIKWQRNRFINMIRRVYRSILDKTIGKVAERVIDYFVNYTTDHLRGSFALSVRGWLRTRGGPPDKIILLVENEYHAVIPRDGMVRYKDNFIGELKSLLDTYGVSKIKLLNVENGVGYLNTDDIDMTFSSLNTGIFIKINNNEEESK